MLNYWIFKWFRKPKQVVEQDKPYPLDQLDKLNKYKNEQHEKAMKAEIKKDPSDAIRKAGW